MSKWIAFSERKPEERQNIYVCQLNDVGHKVIGSVYFMKDFRPIAIKSLRWTHWRELYLPTHIDLEGDKE